MSSEREPASTSETAASALTEAVLAGEAERLAEQKVASEPQVLRDDELPGVGDDAMTLLEGIRAGGFATIALLAALNAFDELDVAAASLLAPEIQDTLGVSDATIAVITVGGSVLLIVGGLVMARLADSMRRTTIVGVATIFWSTIVFFTGFVVNALSYFVARALAAFGRANTLTVQGPIFADAYPIGARARVFAVNNVVGRAGGLLAPLAVGGLVAIVGGDEAWRYAFFLVAWPTLLLGLGALFLPDPPRGQFEQKSTVGEVVDVGTAPPTSLGAAYQRIMQIRTYKNALVAFTAIGFMFVTVPLFVNLYLEDRFDLSPFQRALVSTVPGILTLFVVPLVAKRFDALYRRHPPGALVLIGALFLPLAVLIPIQMSMPSAVSFAVVGGVAGVIASAQFAMIPPLFASINPYYLRAQGTAIGMGLILGIGGVGGAVIGGLLSDAFGPRVAIIVVSVPANLVGGLLLMNGARFIRNDLSLIVEEIHEAEAEQQRLAQDPENIPVLALHNIDFSYGLVQVLFDVDLEVRRGETLALLGTNGAGKSTVLRVISGLGIPSRGVVRLNGRSMTLTSAETRARWGIHQLPGGNATFQPMTVRENLEMAGFSYRRDRGDRRTRIDRVLDMFPELSDRLDARAGELSGGQQQMLGLAMALMHDPEILLIDELSLGLAPTVVQQLLGVVDRLKAAGQTMIIVEQSLNVALAIADRAVFMEKGRIRFEGPAAELLARDDLARAVFLGDEASE